MYSAIICPVIKVKTLKVDLNGIMIELNRGRDKECLWGV